MAAQTDELIWHKDGHKIELLIQKSTLLIVNVHCPFQGTEDAPCSHWETSCVVKWFIDIYAFECNVGVCVPQKELEIAWSFAGSKEKDIAQCQVWFIPTEDEAFAAWLVTQVE
jgi:hypothetical protein